MAFLAIPRHQLETTLAEYGRILSSLVGPAERPDAVRRFEQAFCDYLGCRHAIAVSSGRLGMHLILQSLGLSPGAEVLSPAFNLFAVIDRFRQFGLQPRFCDVDRRTLNLDPASVESRVTANSKVLLVTHMYGHAADLSALTDIARRNDLIVLEDCAHALGTRHGERFVGTFGKASIFSFSVLKLITTFGGGMIATNDDNLAASVRDQLTRSRADRPRPRGLKKAMIGTIMDVGTRKLVFGLGAWPMLRLIRRFKPDFQQRLMTETPKRTGNLDPSLLPGVHAFQARLGLSQLARCEQIIHKRRTVDGWLTEELRDIPEVALLDPDRHGRHNGLYFGIRAQRSAELAAYLFRSGIDCETQEYLNCAELELYRDCACDCPAAREVERSLVRLPNYPGLRRRDVQRIVGTIRRFYA